MTEKTLAKKAETFLCAKPGIQLIKAGTYKLNELSEIRGTPNLKGQILDLPLTAEKAELTLGYFALQPSEDYSADFDFIEVKIVTSGTMIVRDVEGNRYVGEVGDVLIFSPNTTVIFDGESDGEAVFLKNLLANSAFFSN